MKIGYARVSTEDQNLDLQLTELKAAGCERIFQDVASGARKERVGLLDALEAAGSGDVLVVWRLDRLGRSLQHLMDTVEKMRVKGVGFKSLREAIDTTTSGGKLVFHVFGALAEFERELIRERTKAGLAAARVRGRVGGRKVVTSAELILAKDAELEGDGRRVCAALRISMATYYRARRTA